MGLYDDMINLPHPEPDPKKHPRMTLYNRAAIFSPFAALTGHDDAIKETGRLTDRKIELEQDEIEEINSKLMWIRDNIHLKPQAVLTYFIPDYKKSGGKYITATITIKKIDEYEHLIVSTDGTKIAIHNILNLNIL